ncbi:hypothetical protein COU24_03100 [Candidatus Kuenenbacteria bacterium CG10_big_fil_rev_8_21_14_0_10_39_14]|uniref:Calcineurin-like phosphoesterase domain-containing protein n=1 Tax=Candidatus Kuenenbacteria bacterium CG10_big_fil_rev_8_21_14_0_10_39_14 TaxID=1974619 RepID=A0A2H0U6Y9_9BACT|nr:MAG: hypothetical protein COU24_03100 [Candidatus Kuenenbacteria bacterium CG10_big_fil_rev_8_21_14_0_10_39_14]
MNYLKFFYFMINIRIIVFLIFFLLVIFSAHYFIYFSVVRFFSITSPFCKNILLALVFIFPLAFILSSFLTRWQEFFLIRVFYFLSGYWLGLVAYLLMAVSAVWLMVLISKVFGFNINTVVLTASFFILALIISFYGIYNALNPRIKNISVIIPGLADNWQGKKIVQISDAHLGSILSTGFMRAVIEKVNSIEPKMVLITGDFFDSADGNIDTLAKLLNDIKAEAGVFFVTGNHETYLGAEKVLAALEKTKVRVLRDEIIEIDGLKLIGVGYPERDESKDVAVWLESVKEQFYGRPNILLYHSPANAEEIRKKGINLQLSGHTHKGQIFPFGYIAKIVYRGYDYGLHQTGDYSIYISSGVGVWGPTMRTEGRSEIVVITLE